MTGYYLIIGISMLVSWLVSARLKSKFEHYSKVHLRNGMSGKEVAEKMLRDNGIHDVQVISVPGQLTDHYNPANKTVNLSEGVYMQRNAAAAAVAAHECGHAVQHATGYVPLKLRSSLVPVANFGSSIAWPLIILGFFFNSSTTSVLFINLGILAFSLAVLFQIVTLPVEFDASHRALKILGNTGMLYEDEVRDTRKVLTAAALTYVAGAASAILQLLRILLLTGNRRND